MANPNSFHGIFSDESLTAAYENNRALAARNIQFVKDLDDIKPKESEVNAVIAKTNPDLWAKLENLQAQIVAAKTKGDKALDLQADYEQIYRPAYKMAYQTFNKDVDAKLDAYVATKGIHSLDATELMTVFTLKQDIESFQGMIDLATQAKEPDFVNSPIVREFLAVAYNKVGKPDEAIKVGESLIEEGLGNGEVYGAMGKAYLIKHQAAKKYAAAVDKGDETAITKTGNAYRKAYSIGADEALPPLDEVKAQVRPMLEKSRDVYKEGFVGTGTFEYYPGINAAYRELELGNIDEAKKIADLVFLATQRDGGVEVRDYWTTSTVLEAACLSRASSDVIDKALSAIMQYEVIEWHQTSTRDTLTNIVKPALEKLRDASTNQEEKLDIQGSIYTVSRVVNALENRLQGQFFGLPTVVQFPEDVASQDILKNSFSYRGMSTYYPNVVAGNFKYGGPIADHSVTRRDRSEFEKLLDVDVAKFVTELGGDKSELPASLQKGGTLSEIKDPHTFIEAVQLMVRTNFGTERKELEVIDGKTHKLQHDDPMEAVNALSGIPHANYEVFDDHKLTARAERMKADSQTSLVSEFAKGLGDCRHHAQSTQMLFDLWQNKQMNEQLGKAWEASNSGDTAAYSAAIAGFKEIEQLQLRTFDVEVYAPVKVHSVYRPARPENAPQDADEAFILDSKPNKVEEHTMTILVRKNERGHVVSAELADSFYHKPYAWGRGEIDLKSIKTGDDGKIVLPAGKLHNVDGAPDGVSVEIKPTFYAGSRKATAFGDPGLVFERGIPVNDFDLLAVLAKRPEIDARLERTTQWLNNSKQEINAQRQAAMAREHIINPGATVVFSSPTQNQSLARDGTNTHGLGSRA